MKTSPKKAAAAEQRAAHDAWYDEQVRLGLEDIEAGRVVSHEEVQAHFEMRFRQNARRQPKLAA